MLTARLANAKPANAQQRLNTAIQLQSLGQLAAAKEQCLQLLAEQPEDGGALACIGSLCLQLQEPEQALGLLVRALAAMPNNDSVKQHISAAWFALFASGYALQNMFAPADQLIKQRQYILAIALLEPVVQQSHPTPLNSLLAHAYQLSEQWQAAETLYHHVLVHTEVYNPQDFRHVAVNYAMVLLQQGKYAQGWQWYQERTKRPEFVALVAHYGATVWQGEITPGARLLLLPEQGLGDVIMMLRYIPRLQALGIQVNVVVPDALYRLAKQVAHTHVYSPSNGGLGKCDYVAHYMSLPFYLQLLDAAAIASLPYLHGDFTPSVPVHAQAHKVHLGVVCNGNPQFGNDANRSIAWSTLLQGLASCPWLVLHSLQITHADSDKQLLQAKGVHTYDDTINDFADTAAIIGQLDGVISVDTAVAHLAGAMGVPTWLMLAKPREWRWLADCSTTPWYSSMQLLQQVEVGQWDAVVLHLQWMLRQYFTQP